MNFLPLTANLHQPSAKSTVHVILDNLVANICKMDQDISNRKQTWSTAIFPALGRKNLV